MGSGELLGQLVTMLASSLWWRSISSREGGERGGGGGGAGRPLHARETGWS